MQTGQQKRHTGQDPVPGCLLAGQPRRFHKAAGSTLGQSHFQNDRISLSFKSFLGSTEGYKCLEKEKRLFPQVRGEHARAFSSNIN